MFRRRATTSTAAASANPRCVMCGVEVMVDDNGFCPLGHFVGGVVAPVGALPDPARRAEPEPGAVFTEPTEALPVLADPIAPSAAGPVDVPQDVAPVAAPETDTVPLYTGELTDEPVSAAPAEAASSLDALAAMFAEDLAPGAEAGFAVPDEAETLVFEPAAFEPSAFEPAPFEPAAEPEPFESYGASTVESEAQHALDELLSFSSSFGNADEVESAQGFSALDVPADDLGSDEFAAAPEVDFGFTAETEAGGTQSIAAPDDDVDDATVARRRAAGLLGGSVLTLALLAGSIAMLPLF